MLFGWEEAITVKLVFDVLFKITSHFEKPFYYNSYLIKI